MVDTAETMPPTQKSESEPAKETTPVEEGLPDNVIPLVPELKPESEVATAEDNQAIAEQRKVLSGEAAQKEPETPLVGSTEDQETETDLGKYAQEANIGQYRDLVNPAETAYTPAQEQEIKKKWDERAQREVENEAANRQAAAETRQAEPQIGSQQEFNSFAESVDEQKAKASGKNKWWKFWG